MKSLKYLLAATLGLLIVSVLFYGITLPTKNFIGCYVDRKNTKKICINPDNTFEQFIYRSGTWEIFNSSMWSSVIMEDVASEFAVITVESSRDNNNNVLQNVTLQPYRDLLGRVKIPVGLDSGKYEEGEIFKKL